MALAFAGLAVASLTFARHALLAVVPLVILWGLSAWGFIAPQQNRRCGRILRADRGRAIAARMAAARAARSMRANSENDWWQSASSPCPTASNVPKKGSSLLRRIALCRNSSSTPPLVARFRDPSWQRLRKRACLGGSRR
jgi:hypothetical protein